LEDKTLDFLIIGAGKSGTTSLFRYLSAHDSIFMPAEKELSFFIRDDYYRRGMPWCLEEWYGNASPEQMWGEASPQYLAVASAAERIGQTLPDVKMIVILRNPIDRAHSNHRHLERGNVESRPFDECVESLLSLGPDDQRPAEINLGRRAEYIADGEYGRLLANYLRYFQREQLKVLFFDDVVSDPRRVVAEVYQWLGVDPEFVPPNLGQQFNAGGTIRFPRMVQLTNTVIASGRGRRWSTTLLRACGLHHTARSLLLRFNTEWAVKKENSTPLSAELRGRLIAHYAHDVAQLEELLGIEVPWKEFSAAARPGRTPQAGHREPAPSPLSPSPLSPSPLI
jgi:hypothetical protein